MKSSYQSRMFANVLLALTLEGCSLNPFSMSKNKTINYKPCLCGRGRPENGRGQKFFRANKLQPLLSVISRSAPGKDSRLDNSVPVRTSCKNSSAAWKRFASLSTDVLFNASLKCNSDV